MININKNQFICFICCIFIFQTLFSGCEIEKEIDYNALYGGDKMVIHGFLHNKGAFLQLNKTVPPLSRDKNDYISNAKVSLYSGNEQAVELIEHTPGYFETPCDFKPTDNTTYQIVAEAEGFSKVFSSKQIIMSPVLIDTAYYIKETPTSKMFDLYFSYTDPSTEENYYFYKILYFTEGIIENENDYIEYIDPFSWYSDDEFNGTRRTEYILYYEGRKDTPDIDSARIILYTLSNDLKKYLESIENYDTTKEDPFYEQPAQIFTNIINGYGIFAGLAVDSITLSLR